MKKTIVVNSNNVVITDEIIEQTSPFSPYEDYEYFDGETRFYEVDVTEEVYPGAIQWNQGVLAIHDQQLYEAANVAAWDVKREERNTLLTSSDWINQADNGLSDSDKASWIDYRQRLRDIPNELEGTNPNLVVWPDKPV